MKKLLSDLINKARLGQPDAGALFDAAVLENTRHNSDLDSPLAQELESTLQTPQPSAGFVVPYHDAVHGMPDESFDTHFRSILRIKQGDKQKLRDAVEEMITELEREARR